MNSEKEGNSVRIEFIRSEDFSGRNRQIGDWGAMPHARAKACRPPPWSEKSLQKKRLWHEGRKTRSESGPEQQGVMLRELFGIVYRFNFMGVGSSFLFSAS